ncbi:tRNA (adenosine(37)-N6)-threonylcarbamoyltransferase complex ATPase subunit type 1 TsaE [Verminephrobacter eiseniae]|uniref:tRNA (adenosine(37)-N6)-threonylcarbamoyltransferase complex ATPase subunit type 1 TsaE n=1 Tax=Verminephrobacter eiseniae TaxID=364317 RepID=UPI002237AC54|nr:tRNA (adenosine(37)-N6)-threonylcarbamoyltransferase complex ATPase subunit type 1 TsaE [Verminephrobacter eiseniae]MCW5235494.1 tRNA (adenosine(37)-N6)-threonylcarbamoyltransferase complex ATPase subunit type 1 TsaE [Verminephrobacter eiseniae]
MTVAPHTGQIVESSAGQTCRHFTWRSEDDTAAFARRLAAQPLIGNAYLTLHGDLGAGKTTLVRHLLRALGVQGRIKSPTYTVAEPHEAPHLAPHTLVWHFDFYRFDDPREWEDAGFRELFAQPGLKLAEWPEKAAALAPPADLAIHLQTIDDTARQVTLHAHSRTGRSLLQGL